MAFQKGERGDCGRCRHINCETDDFHESGIYWTCRFYVPIWANNHKCCIRFEDTGEFVFEPYDGHNCSWRCNDVAKDHFEGRKIVDESEWIVEAAKNHGEIANLAYSLWEADGRPASDGKKYWYAAIKSRFARQ